MSAPSRRPVAVVTGASSGIGVVTAVELARRGYDVALTARDATRLEQTAQRCREAGAQARTYPADFAELAQVRALASSLLEDWPRLDVLVNNAGLVLTEREVTPDGYEKVFAVNHLAPYLLTRLLLDRLVDSAPSRVVVVASDAYKFGDVDPDDWMGERGWRVMKAYGRSKLCNLLFVAELRRRVDGTGVAVNAVHPGFVASGLGRQKKVADVALRLVRPFFGSPAKGARSTLVVATEPLGAVNAGAYVVGGKVRETHPRATDETTARRLWDDSARLVGLEP